jgi:RNA polymerase sigma factor (sigma-70 family)
MLCATACVDLPEDGLRNLKVPELVFLCARDTGNTQLWGEFLRRFAGPIRLFIRRILRHSGVSSNPSARGRVMCGVNQDDLFQNTVLRLVDRDCSVLKGFKGTCDEEFLTYLAITTRSVVMDSLRREKALKRPSSGRRTELDALDFAGRNGPCRREPAVEREVLGLEVWRITLRTIENLSGPFRIRDRQIFELYFLQGLSVGEIARLKTIRLSKTAIQNFINRLQGRVRATTVSGSAATTPLFVRQDRLRRSLANANIYLNRGHFSRVDRV